MNTITSSIAEALLELRQSSRMVHLSKNIDAAYHELIHKYDIVFVGEKFNVINSIELRHTLANFFNIRIDNTALNQMIPDLCKSLGMTCEPLAELEDLSNPVPAAFMITLYK